MRILALTSTYPNPFEPDRAVYNRCQLGLIGRNHEVRVIAPIAWTDEYRAWRTGARLLPRDRRVTLDGVTVDHPRYWFPPRLLRSRYGSFYRWSVRTAFEKALAELSPDIVYAPWVYPDGWAGVKLGHEAGLPVVVKTIGSDVLLLRQYPARNRGTIEALREADGVIAVSQDLGNCVQEFGVDPARLHVIYDGVEAELFHPGPAPDARRRLGLPEDGPPMILFVGNLAPVKGIDVLIEACARLARSGVAFTCNLIGQGSLRDALNRQIQGLGLEFQVHLLGGKPHDDLPDWYRAATVFALASHSEGVPNVLLEAAACGTPFVASRVGGIPEITHLGAHRLVPAGDVTALAEAINAFLKSPVMQRNHGAARRSEETVGDMICVFEQTRVRFRSCASAAACIPALG